MKNRLFCYASFVGVLSLIILLTLTGFVQAAVETWTASVSFNMKETERVKDTSGNHKLGTSTETFEGTVNLFWDTDLQEPVQQGGCILELLGTDGTKICFDELFGINSDNKKSGKGSALLVATGTISTTAGGQAAAGIAFLFNNGRANLAFDSSGNPTAFTLNGTIGGAFTPDGDKAAIIFSGTIPNTPLKLAE